MRCTIKRRYSALFVLFKSMRDVLSDRFNGSLFFTYQNLIAGLVFPGVSTGGNTSEVSKSTNKVGVVGKTGQFTGLLHTDTLLQKLPRF